METNLVERIAAKASTLPVQLQQKALEYVESLEREGTQEKTANSFRSVKGVLQADLNNLEKDLSEVRAEMWRKFPRDESK